MRLDLSSIFFMVSDLTEDLLNTPTNIVEIVTQILDRNNYVEFTILALAVLILNFAMLNRTLEWVKAGYSD